MKISCSSLVFNVTGEIAACARQDKSEACRRSDKLTSKSAASFPVKYFILSIFSSELFSFFSFSLFLHFSCSC